MQCMNAKCVRMPTAGILFMNVQMHSPYTQLHVFCNASLEITIEFALSDCLLLHLTRRTDLLFYYQRRVCGTV